MKKSQQYYLLLLCFMGMALFAISFSYRGFLIPTFKADFGIDNTKMGFVLSAAQLVSVIFTYYGGVYCLRLGQKRIIGIGCFLLALSLVLLSISKSWVMLLISYCGMSSGGVLMVLGLNTMMPVITLLSQSLLMNLIHGSFGLSATAVQKALAWYITAGYDWRLLFLITAGLAFIQGVLMMGAPGEPTDEHRAHKSSLPHLRFSVFVIIGLSLYVVAEFLMGSWIINYFQEGFNFDPVKAAFYSTLFYGTFTVGRLMGGFVFRRIDMMKGIITCMLLATLSVAFGQILGGRFLFLIGFSGIFFSIVYPITVTLTNAIYGKEGPYFLGIASTVTAIAAFAINLVFGYLNDVVGVLVTFYGIPVCLGLGLLFYILAFAEKKQVLSEHAVGLRAV